MIPADELMPRLEALLRQHPLGISEFDIITALHNDPDTPFKKPVMSDSWALFQCHFWLFHCLHLLRLELAARTGEHISIIATRVELQPQRTEAVVDEHTSTIRQLAALADPMQEYYLDIENLYRETPESIHEKLDHFWRRLSDPVHEQDDWAILELKPPISADRLRQQYRRLCQKHHPDRGGNAEHFRQVQSAYARLRGSKR
ncbi:DnaJ domain-containing protein [Salinispirillum sp. LH 10-3-1]|uniref:DnaJ domain-containing protein n=1 Tax=Salinispirillum sp. LH 10-3-1 TaxID=2952525 RepID=A0AB38YJT3_9GAMM